MSKIKIETGVPAKAEKKAKQIFMAFYKITCSVLDSKACALYHIQEMKEVDDPSENIFWDDVKKAILSGIKMD